MAESPYQSPQTEIDRLEKTEENQGLRLRFDIGWTPILILLLLLCLFVMWITTPTIY